MTMEESIFRQVFPFVRLATDYVATKFGVSDVEAAELVDGVLAGLLPKHPQPLNNPKRYFLRACRWKALKTFRRQGSPEAPEILVALEDNDRERFFGSTCDIKCGTEPAEFAATVEVPGSLIRLKVSLPRPHAKDGRKGKPECAA
jgi:hypothetical protein